MNDTRHQLPVCDAITSVLSLQSAGINGTELDTPEADCFSGYSDSPFGEQIFDIAVT